MTQHRSTPPNVPGVPVVLPLLLLLAALALQLAGPRGAEALELADGLQQKTVVSGLEQPVDIAFTPDDRILIAEKRGTVLALDGYNDNTPQIVWDERDEVHNFFERGLVSIALDPAWPQQPFLYLGYTRDAPIGQAAPVYGGFSDEDPCRPGPPDTSFEDGCVASAQLSRIRLNPGTLVQQGPEQKLIEDWCITFPLHTIGDISFDSSGALVMGGADGASATDPDYGQFGDPPDACNDPAREGGALRAQDLVTPGDPVSLDGTIIRVNRATGAPLPDNPRSSGSSQNERRILSYGHRNPFRFNFMPGTDDLYIAETGSGTEEEINLLGMDDAKNFGWPCYEGTGIQSAYAGVEPALGICQTLYARPNLTSQPWFTYRHQDPVFRGDSCDARGGSMAGLVFDAERGLPYPYDSGMFISDFTRKCIFFFEPRKFGKLKTKWIGNLASELTSGTFNGPISLATDPDGGLLWFDYNPSPQPNDGTLQRISAIGRTVEVKLQSKPRGLKLKADERKDRSNYSVTYRRNSKVKLVAPKKQRKGNKLYAFQKWKDKGSKAGARGQAKRTVRVKKNSRYKAVYKRCKNKKRCR